MPSLEILMAFAGATLLVVAIPGPSVAYVVARSTQHGTAAGLLSMLGLETGAAVHAALAAAGVAALLALAPMGMEVVGWAGAAYLVWMAARTVRDRNAEQDAGPTTPQRGRLFLDGLLVDLLNPKTALFFLAFLPQFVRPDRGPSAVQLAVLGALFVLIAAACDSTYAMLAARLTVRLRASRTAQRRIALATAAVYVILAVVVLVL